jgi:hypothetical protein
MWSRMPPTDRMSPISLSYQLSMIETHLMGPIRPPEGVAMLARAQSGGIGDLALRSAPTRRADRPHEMGLYYRDVVPCRPGQGFSISRWCSTPSAGASSAGRRPATCKPASSRRRSTGCSLGAGQTTSSITLIRDHTIPRPLSAPVPTGRRAAFLGIGRPRL